MAAATLQETYRKLYAEFEFKWILLTALGIFELGVLICSVSRSSLSFILGRAIAGIGVAGTSGGFNEALGSLYNGKRLLTVSSLVYGPVTQVLLRSCFSD